MSGGQTYSYSPGLQPCVLLDSAKAYFNNKVVKNSWKTCSIPNKENVPHPALQCWVDYKNDLRAEEFAA